MANMVNASHLPRYLHPLFFGMQMWHLPSLPYIHSSVLTLFATYLWHIYKAQKVFCTNPLSHTVELTWAYVHVYLFLMFVCLTWNTRCFSLAVQNNSPIQECKKNHRDLYPPLCLPQLCVCHKYMCTCGQFNTTFTSLIYKCSYFLVSENNNCTCKLYL